LRNRSLQAALKVLFSFGNGSQAFEIAGGGLTHFFQMRLELVE
jgi:hypothetical protein